VPPLWATISTEFFESHSSGSSCSPSSFNLERYPWRAKKHSPKKKKKKKIFLDPESSFKIKKTWISSWRVKKAKKWVVHYWEITHACSCHLLDSWDSGLLPRFSDFLFFQPPHAWTLKATTGQGTLEELKKRKAMGTLSLPQDSNLQEDCKDLRSSFKG
jgi:hypothetical protein